MGTPLRRLSAALAAASLLALASAAGAATITINNIDGAGEGFNDATAAAPVGGNPGVTVGAQRLFVFQHAAAIWGSILPSNVEIVVNAQMNPQSCNATSGVLGSAGPVTVHANFAGAPLAGHWYHQALANRLLGSDNSGSNDINTTFNSSVGLPTCLTVGWYYGIDGNEGGQIELLPVVLHELGHGLGFSTTTNGQTGAYNSGLPSIYDHFLFDLDANLHWDEMTQAQRAASGINCLGLVWDGPNATAFAPSFLGPKPLLDVHAPPAAAGEYEVGLAQFGPTPFNLTANVVLANDGSLPPNSPTNGCEPFTNGAAIAGNIAFVDRGTCAFTVKVKNAQDAGAIAVIVADSVAGCPPLGMGGVDATITIPSVRITLSDGALLKANLVGLNATVAIDPARYAGTDALNRPFVYSPSTFAGGSSISHWDTSAEPSLLMEPAITGTLSGTVDLTRYHFADIGWFTPPVGVGPNAAAAGRLLGNVPNPFHPSTAIRFNLPRAEKVELMIHDLAGRLVRHIEPGVLQQGAHSVSWDGTSEDGRRVAPGVYLYRIKTPTFSESRQMVMVK